MDTLQQRVFSILFPYAWEKVEHVQQQNLRFVHYCGADAAMSMLSTRQVWMRNATCMNDFSEIEHGLNCLISAYDAEEGENFRTFIDSIHPGISKELQNLFNSWVNDFRTGTYIACISEHDDDEDQNGRLSMWRAYGNGSGIAIVLNNTAFLSDSDALRAYSSPVMYADVSGFKSQFLRVVDSMRINHAFLKEVPRKVLFNNLFHMLRFAVLCTKHPGFSEEKEWRVIYSPKFDNSPYLTQDLVSVRGVPQHVFRIPLQNIPSENFYGASVDELVDRIIIGPTQYGSAIKAAFTSLLEQCGTQDAANRVWISQIPLRQ